MNGRACQSVGIDLGTTYSALAYTDDQLVPRVVPDSSGKAVVPSVVYFDEQEVIVGDIAVQQARVRADRVVQFVKTHIGDDWRFEANGRTHTPESISAYILAHLMREAEPQIGPVRTAVITVPAYFTEKRRRATQQAGEIAGLKVLGTLNEPMAAALAYGLHREAGDQTVVVYDLGGGTFDVTVVRVTPNELEELATAGNRQLGGKDWDQCLVDLVADDFQRRHRIDLRRPTPEARQALQDLQLGCEAAKRQLGRMARTAVRVQAFGVDHVQEVTREQFEEATAGLLQSTRLTTEVALQDAGLRWADVSRVMLIGGSTLMPGVRRMLQEASGKPPDTGINPVTAVALGAAVYGHILETGKGPKAVRTLPAVRFVTAHGVGVRAHSRGEWTNAVLIPKNTPVPAAATRTFRTMKKGTRAGTRIRVTVTQGDTPDAGLAEVLGNAVITGIPPGEAGGQPVGIAITFNEQGRLELQAEYVPTGQRLNLELDIPNGLREEQVREYRRVMAESGMIPPSTLLPDEVLSFDDDPPLLDLGP